MDRPAGLGGHGHASLTDSSAYSSAPLRKMAVTSWPAAASSRMNRDPVKELPPVKRIFIGIVTAEPTAFRRGQDRASR